MTSLSQTYKNLINLACLKRSVAIVFLLEDKNDLLSLLTSIWPAKSFIMICFASAFVSWLAASSVLVTRTKTGSTTHTCMTLFFYLLCHHSFYHLPNPVMWFFFFFWSDNYVIDRLLYVTLLGIYYFFSTIYNLSN